MEQPVINPKRFFRPLLIVVILVSAYLLGSAIYTTRTTGILVASSTPGSVLSIVRSGYAPVFVNSSSLKLHLPPGTYQVVATQNKNQAIKSVVIRTKQTSHLVVAISAQSPAQSAAITNANQLIKLLPFTGPSFDYSINYTYSFNNNQAQPIITITPQSANGTQEALDWIRQQGYDTSKLQIEVLSPQSSENGQ